MVCTTLGPTAQNRLGQVSQLTGVLPSNPPVAVSSKVGKKAARAMPICSLASAARRSAAAISGRRSSSCDGMPTGITGGVLVKATGGRLQALRRATHQHGDGMFEGGALHAYADVLSARGFELRSRLRHFGAGAQAAIEAILRQVERLLISHQRLIQQLLLRVEAAQFEVVDGQFGMQAEANGFQIGGAGLGLFAGGGDGAMNAAPGVQLVIDVDRQRVFAKVTVTGSQWASCCESRLVVMDGRGRDGGEETGAIQLNQRARLAKAGFRGLESLVGRIDLLLQTIQFRVAEELPPVCAQCCCRPVAPASIPSIP